VLALDGIPYRAVERAREFGAFSGWPEAKPLLSTFPSMTNVAFTAMLQPFGLEEVRGYEVRHYDSALNKVVGGGHKYKANMPEWRNRFDVASRSLGSKFPQYALGPRKAAWRTLDKVESLVRESSKELMLAHVGGTDTLAHFRGGEAAVEFLIELSRRVTGLKQLHLDLHGRPLTVVLLSDHGNSGQGIKSGGGIKRQLRQAGLRVTQRLNRPTDVVAPMFGVISYGVLHLDPRYAERAASAVVKHPMVDLAAWRSDAAELQVIAEEGEATIVWREAAGRRRFNYRAERGDPLKLSAALAQLKTGDLLDEEGFAAQEDWFTHSALGEFPDAIGRLVDALTGTHVLNAATVIYSVAPGHAVGSQMGRLGAWLKGGQEGTHGGLDRASTLGFFLTDDPTPNSESAMRVDHALTAWVHLANSDTGNLETSGCLRLPL
jgi:hypothetical protein